MGVCCWWSSFLLVWSCAVQYVVVDQDVVEFDECLLFVLIFVLLEVVDRSLVFEGDYDWF